MNTVATVQKHGRKPLCVSDEEIMARLREYQEQCDNEENQNTTTLADDDGKEIIIEYRKYQEQKPPGPCWDWRVYDEDGEIVKDRRWERRHWDYCSIVDELGRVVKQPEPKCWDTYNHQMLQLKNREISRENDRNRHQCMCDLLGFDD